ncbi:ABC transporter ATP-binding protein [Mediterraneibacter sp. NSJ-55]|uniref:ABC transporter ATP-binding protein n=1 Tax=Mediterraneibacter hominis TaxID=2763054 RepID=A0A923RNK6_9FIRM|nr:ABC transporter ATP-binding protein [Mediterraneibacter hominis]MBC5687495.1 ABC transporter ATP-binding protein [Mediterraneibacter hominis]
MLKMDRVEKGYEKFRLQCSLEVKPGFVTGLVGPNGAGKSTAFKAALGLIHTDGGKVEIFGKDSAKLTNRDKAEIGVVLADSGFSEYLSIKDISRVMSALYPGFEKTKFLKQCEQFHLPVNKRVKTFSTGMKAKLKLLLALSHKAKMLVLDEPTAGLDVAAREDLLDILREYMEEDTERAILISSHISGDLEGLCDDLYLIQDGQIVMHEETDILLDQYGVLKVDEEQFRNLDTQYILRRRKETFGYRLLTDQKQYYVENYPKMVIENANIDEVVLMMMKGEEL